MVFQIVWTRFEGKTLSKLGFLKTVLKINIESGFAFSIPM
jgi:hypothetical protein